MARPALAAERALAVIDLLVGHSTERFNLTEISRRTGINPSSTHALLNAMLGAGYLQRHPVHKTYALGTVLVAAGTASLEQLPGVRDAMALIDELSDELGLEVLVTSAADEEIIVVARSGHASPFGAVMTVGHRLPLVPPFGTIFLAWSDPETIAEWLGRADPGLTAEETEQQRGGLDVVRSRGYAVASDLRRGEVPSGDMDSDFLAELAHGDYHLTTIDDGAAYDVSMVAAPVFDSHQTVIAAIVLNGFAPELSAAELTRIADRISGVARIVTKQTLGRLPAELD